MVLGNDLFDHCDFIEEAEQFANGDAVDRLRNEEPVPIYYIGRSDIAFILHGDINDMGEKYVPEMKEDTAEAIATDLDKSVSN